MNSAIRQGWPLLHEKTSVTRSSPARITDHGSRITSSLSLSEIRDSLDFDERFRTGQRSHFHQRRRRKVAREELAARAPHLGVVLDIDHEDGHLDDVFQAAAGPFADMPDAREDLLRLLVLGAAYQSLTALERTRHLTRDEEEIPGTYAVRPQTGACFGYFGDIDPGSRHGGELLGLSATGNDEVM